MLDTCINAHPKTVTGGSEVHGALSNTLITSTQMKKLIYIQVSQIIAKIFRWLWGIQALHRRDRSQEILDGGPGSSNQARYEILLFGLMPCGLSSYK